ncbi:unnamed protein product, partial [marine sediment metagenome]
DDQFVEKVCDLVKERATFVHELWDHAWFIFKTPEEYDQKTMRRSWKEQTPRIMKELYEVLSDITDFTSVNTEKVVRKWIEEKDYGVGQVMNAFRLCIVGEALPIFQKLLENDPANSNLRYYIGVCYYHTNNYNASKEYLTIASENTSEKYKDSVFEKNAPQDVFSYLEFIENIELKN